MTIASKINTKSALVFLGFLMIVFVFAIGHVSAAELNVSKTPTNDDYSDIATAVQDSGSDGIITIYSGTYSGEKNTGIRVSKNITIRGASYLNKSLGKTIIDGSNQNNAIFYIDEGVNVNIYDIVFRDSGYFNGALESYGTLTIRNSEFVNNFVGVNSNGKVDIANSNFTDNRFTALKIDSEGSIIKSSNFISNALAFEISGSNNQINYNRISNNSMDIINYGDKTNINFNWWGNNQGTVIASAISGQYNLIKLYWFVLELSSDSVTALGNAEANYTGGELALLKYRLTTNEKVPSEYGFDSSLLPVFKVYLTNPTGTKISWDSNSDYTYRLTGFKGNISYFKISADKEAYNLKINFLGGIIPSIQPTFCSLPEDEMTKAKTPNQATTPAAGSPDESETTYQKQGNNPGNIDTQGSNGDNGEEGDVSVVKASMKETAMPLIAMLLSIFTIGGIFIRKN